MTDDPAAMHGVPTRRFRRGQKEEADEAFRDALAEGADGAEAEAEESEATSGAKPA